MPQAVRGIDLKQTFGTEGNGTNSDFMIILFMFFYLEFTLKRHPLLDVLVI